MHELTKHQPALKRGSSPQVPTVIAFWSQLKFQPLNVFEGMTIAPHHLRARVSSATSEIYVINKKCEEEVKQRSVAIPRTSNNATKREKVGMFGVDG